MSIDLVSAVAGDRVLTEAEATRIRDCKLTRGKAFYSDLLFAVCNRRFASGIAATLWKDILTHKRRISDRLARNVSIAVASLDYLSNIILEMKSATLISEDQVSELTALAMRDRMTGLFNHATGHELLALDLVNQRRYGGFVSVIVLDIDDFKAVNDLYGHQEGDRVLIELAKVLIGQTRDSDICCRIGGDEFLVILRNAGMDYTSDVAARIREGCSRIRSDGRRIAVSLGIAVGGTATGTARALIQAADKAMYIAKRPKAEPIP